ncbi:LacI family DNA-binding transcriptional regulator [Streptomyces litchfieldiae]|uniref:LacI family DNA-binding transcriptional regulator n=1 Tax=Streptomyces litchfieldiae TaxID=3075543 RepID=A0ABU2MWW7_9ACTN|nr:LacI family DNA-binding transcriptional regulator [Streptomyces sp. DSM 44938]MDT0345054.1 LacI family DNA-binding transcriptional regulator [Streptomyces sp. DSM 44938]
MVTMSEVAKAAGVSVMTVSNVINGHRYVSDATRDRVLAAVDRLGYRVNVAARSLRSGSTGIIGLAVPDIDTPYFGQLASLLIERAARLGYQVVVEQTGATRENELGALAHSRVRRYDGLILSTVELGDEDADQLRSDLPVVALGERLSGGHAVDHVAMANVEGARDATRHLIERGCRRIAAFGAQPGPEVNANSLRTAGYHEALTDAGLDPSPELAVPCAFSMAGGAAAARSLLAGGIPFDGAVCFTDTVAIGALRALADHGVAVPDEVKVIGFDDVEQGRYTVPSLSTIAPGHSEMVDAALRMLGDRIAGRRGEDEHEMFTGPHQLVIRQSTGGP